MKQLFKKLFSRMLFVGLTIAVMIVLFFVALITAVLLFNWLFVMICPPAEPYVQTILTVFAWLVTVVAVMHAANRDMVPETKIPWILAIVGLNLFGVFLYVLFSSHTPRRGERKMFHALREETGNYRCREFSKEELRKKMGHWAQVSEALSTMEPMAVVHGGTKTEYFPSGEAFHKRVLEDLAKAEKFIFLEYFIIQEGIFFNSILDLLRRKVKEGVEVRLMYDDIGCMAKVRGGYYKKLRRMGIDCVKFNPFVPVVTNLHNNRDHRKILIIDGVIGYTGGLNLADEYINETHPFGYWKDTAVRLEGAGVQNLTTLFLGLFSWQSRRKEDFSRYIPETFEDFGEQGLVQPYGSGPSPLYERHLAEDVYINVLNAAHDYVYIATPYLIIDYRMREALILAARRGVDVRVVVPHIPDKKIAFSLTRSNFLALIRGGVKVYEYTPGFIHAKLCLADGAVAVVGTVNLDYRSFLYHFEDAVLLYKTEAVGQIGEDFAVILSDSALQTEKDARKNVIWRGLCEIAKIFAPLF